MDINEQGFTAKIAIQVENSILDFQPFERTKVLILCQDGVMLFYGFHSLGSELLVTYDLK